MANSSSAYLFILLSCANSTDQENSFAGSLDQSQIALVISRLLISAAGRKVKTLLVAFQSALHHVMSRSYAWDYIRVATRNLIVFLVFLV